MCVFSVFEAFSFLLDDGFGWAVDRQTMKALCIVVKRRTEEDGRHDRSVAENP
jgi:hypothetical protein